MRLEEAMKALEEAKAKAREDAEARAAAESKAREEAEARKREEAASKAREEAERRQREEAEARANAQLRELRDQSQRARVEAEARADVEIKARIEAEARIETERRAREQAEAKAEAEKQSREEAIGKAREEAELKARAEVEALIAAERKAHEQADEKARAELSARIEAEKKARAEAERQTEIAHRAREEAERYAREANSTGSGAAQKALEQAEAAAKAAETAVAQARATAESERKARALAEERAKAEAVARVVQEQKIREGADDEIRQRVNAELKAREIAERDADARYRVEAAERARAAAAERQKQREEELAHPVVTQARKPANLLKAGAIGIIVLIAAAVGLLHVVPLTFYIDGAQALISQRLQQPVTIANLRYALFPSAQLTLEHVTIGNQQQIKIKNIVVDAGPFALLGAQKDIDRVVVNSLETDRDMLAQIAAWAKVPAGAQALQIPRLSIKLIKLHAKPLDIPLFNADITFNRNGGLKKAVFLDDKLRVEFAPKDRLWEVNFSAHGWQPPVGPAIEFDDLAFSAVIDGQQATFSGIEGSIGRGTFTGTAAASWKSDIRVEGEFKLDNANLDRLLPAFTRNFAATGTFNVKGNYVLQGANLTALFDKPRIDAGFSAQRGELDNVDIVRAIQAPSRDGTRGGKTAFDELSGSLQLADDHYAYHALRLASGPMSATGNVDIAPDGALSGRIAAEVGSKSIVVARGSLNVGGHVRTPVLKP